MKEFEDNNQIIIAIRNGDRCAYEYVYKHYYRELFYYAQSFMLSKSEAFDILHDTFVTIIERRDKLSEQTDFKGYLYLSVKNSCLNRLKHYNVTMKHQESVVEEMRFQYEDTNSEKEQLENRLQQLINQLPLQQQTILRMKIEGKSYEEIADQLNISKLTVSVHVKRAYQFIRENIFIFLFFLLPFLYLILK